MPACFIFDLAGRWRCARFFPLAAQQASLQSRGSASMEIHRSIRPGNRLLAAAVALTLASAAYAADEVQVEGSGGLEEIVVTGTKRDEAAQDVPIAISAISETALQSAHVNDVRALQNLAPGLVLSNPAGFNATGGGMRGTGTNIILVTQDAPVSFLMDEFALSHVTSQFVSLFDTQQVEVYRGPQGTLFGKNTTGGVISITSKKPVLGEYSAETQLSYGQYEGSASARSVSAAVNVPIGETLAMRIAAIYDQDDGFYTDDKETATFPVSVPLWGAFGIPAGAQPPPELNTNVRGGGGDLGGKDVIGGQDQVPVGADRLVLGLLDLRERQGPLGQPSGRQREHGHGPADRARLPGHPARGPEGRLQHADLPQPEHLHGRGPQGRHRGRVLQPVVQGALRRDQVDHRLSRTEAAPAEHLHRRGVPDAVRLDAQHVAPHDAAGAALRLRFRRPVQLRRRCELLPRLVRFPGAYLLRGTHVVDPVHRSGHGHRAARRRLRESRPARDQRLPDAGHVAVT